ncbi:MAG: alpha/beta hydrolase-fold protein [Acidobacteriaceae bacterium]
MNTSRIKRTFAGILLLAPVLLLALVFVAPAYSAPVTRFEVSLPVTAASKPITGRVFVIITRTNRIEPRIQLLSEQAPPFFGKDIHALQPGQSVTIDETTPGYPLDRLKDLPAGDYYVEAFLNVYTEFHRSDGHTVWAHMDWVGELPTVASGNLYSDTQKIHLDPATGFNIRLSLDKAMSEDAFNHGAILGSLAPPKQTEWIKVVKFQSPMLTKFWGQPMYLGATVLLPKGYDTHPNVHYPVVYNQGHFYQPIPWEFNPDPKSETPGAVREGKASNMGTGYEFYQAWNSDHFPRFILVTWQHPCPYFDDSYAVNSANCGPFGDAIMDELIPYVESHFRVLRRPYARIVEGGSTGGWESLALQVYHPKFFGGAWVFDPDPIDFQRFQQVNLYKDDTSFEVKPFGAWLSNPRPWSRTPAGQVRSTVEDVSHYEDVLGPNGRSDYQLDGWWAIFDPVGKDGYPMPAWNMQTGKIDPAAVAYMRDHGYDLTDYTRNHWAQIGPDLVGKLHFFVGDMDSYYLNLAVYQMEDFLKTTKSPYYAGTFTYGRPMKGHGWHPMSWADLLRDMAAQVSKNAPKDADNSQWNY